MTVETQQSDFDRELEILRSEFVHMSLTRPHFVVIFGSWVSCHHGAAYGPPNDIDVLIVTEARCTGLDASFHVLVEHAESCEDRISQSGKWIPVNFTVRTLREWMDPEDPLLGDVRSWSHIVLGNKPGEDLVFVNPRPRANRH
ncbi:hypothetical protein ACPXCG_03435 [Gordonia sp. DT218]|uniref:hypothetical protein n=1 Tax=Gordonia sp. DT218 TaxID=3416659 RepID=UPI003CEE2878